MGTGLIRVGKYTVFYDAEDSEVIAQHKWMIVGDGYAANRTNGQSMHRMLTRAKDGEIVDHINGNKLDNRKSNLRLVTMAQSNCNRAGRKNSTSKYKGVSWSKRYKKWRVDISVNKVKRNGEYFEREVDAAKRYNQLAKELHGEYARLNHV